MNSIRFYIIIRPWSGCFGLYRKNNESKRGRSITRNIPSPGYDRGLDYPHIDPQAFESSCLIRIDSGEIIRGEDVDHLVLCDERSDIVLPESGIVLPGHTVRLGGRDAVTLEDRIAIIGYGSNCSPEVLLEKFRAADIHGDFILAQADLEGHTICHGAFLGGLGTILATVFPHKETTAHITVSFLTQDQAAALTGTEPNYDLVALKDAVPLRGLKSQGGGTVVPEEALVYVSFWGGLRDPEDSGSPIALEAIPQDTSLRRMDSREAMAHVAGALGITDIPGFFNHIAAKENGMPLRERLGHNFALARDGYTLPAQIRGTPVKSSTIAAACAEYGMSPSQILYR